MTGVQTCALPICRPDQNAVFLVPWAIEPTAQVIHDTYDKQGNPIELSPRNVHEIVELGQLDPESIVTPGIFVSQIVRVDRVATQAGGIKKAA